MQVPEGVTVPEWAYMANPRIWEDTGISYVNEEECRKFTGEEQFCKWAREVRSQTGDEKMLAAMDLIEKATIGRSLGEEKVKSKGRGM